MDSARRTQPQQTLSGRSSGRSTRDVRLRAGPSSSAQRRNLPRSVEVGTGRKFTIEILMYGIIMPYALWSTRQAIFPKGFRSRVRYWSVLQPTMCCNYICEILDAGLAGPLFLVSVEGNPTEVFSHVSPMRCWDLVIQKVNQINKHFYETNKKRGRPTNPQRVQKPGSVDGLEMFGLSAPAVLRALEAMDSERVSTEYWRFKNQARVNEASSVVAAAAEGRQPNPLLRRRAPEAPQPILQELFRKANPEELRALEIVLRGSNTRRDVASLVSEEIRSRRRRL